VIGSGTGIPSARRRSPALLVRWANQLHLFDCGAGTSRAMAEANLDVHQVDWLWLTHFHPDHTGDLGPLLFAARSPLYGRRKTLHIGGAVGLRSFYRKLKDLYGRWVQLAPGLLQFYEIEPSTPATLNLGPGKITFFAMNHTEASIGYRLETANGKILCYSGDTDYCANAVQLASNADLFFCECSFPEHHRVEGHLTPRLAGRIAREANCKRLVLLHCYPICDETDIAGSCRLEYEGPVTVAEDLTWFLL